MSTLTVTAKGQVTLRKELLEHLVSAPVRESPWRSFPMAASR
jgi:hypothetical protein